MRLWLKDKHGEGGKEQSAAEGASTNLPGHLALPGSGIDPLHYPNSVKRRENVEGLEEAIPKHLFGEEVGISRTKNQGIQHLGDEGDT